MLYKAHGFFGLSCHILTNFCSLLERSVKVYVYGKRQTGFSYGIESEQTKTAQTILTD